MTRWEHARLEKPVLSRDAGRWLSCCWDECDRQGFDSNKAVVHDHARGLSCDHPDAKHPQYIFCTDRHKQYWINSHRSLGNLPAGERLRVWLWARVLPLHWPGVWKPPPIPTPGRSKGRPGRCRTSL